MSRRDLGFVFWPFAQGLASGAVTGAVIDRQWLALFAFTVSLNLMWWYNTGQRIERQQERYAGLVYSTSISLGLVLGAWGLRP